MLSSRRILLDADRMPGQGQRRLEEFCQWPTVAMLRNGVLRQVSDQIRQGQVTKLFSTSNGNDHTHCNCNRLRYSSKRGNIVTFLAISISIGILLHRSAM